MNGNILFHSLSTKVIVKRTVLASGGGTTS